MSVIPLSGTRRETSGKGPARRARREGRIPAVLYGHGDTPVSLAVSARDFDLALHGRLGGNPIVNLSLGDGGEVTALIREIQRDPVTHDILHLDFFHISLTEKIEVNVALRLTGLPHGVKEGGGILETILREVRVRCLPTKIPSHLEVDVSALDIGDSVHVAALSALEVEVLTDPEATVATVVPPTVIEEKPAEVVAAAAETPAEPEVITKGKKEEGEGEEAPEKAEKK